MSSGSPAELTELLRAAGGGDEAAQARVWEVVYGELRTIAQREMRRMPTGGTVSPTVLVHEAYLRLCKGGAFENRRHFYAAAALVMRHVRADYARRKMADKRNAGLKPLPLAADFGFCQDDPARALALDEAVSSLEKERPDLAEIVRLRYDIGLTVDEVAELIGVSARTVNNRWRLARAWLHRALGDGTAT